MGRRVENLSFGHLRNRFPVPFGENVRCIIGVAALKDTQTESWKPKCYIVVEAPHANCYEFRRMCPDGLKSGFDHFTAASTTLRDDLRQCRPSRFPRVSTSRQKVPI
jgi:hypothetical protein